jgi:hypothetical protein
MAEAVEEHLGTMAYAAWFQSVSPLPIRKGGEKIRVSGEGLHTAYVGKPVCILTFFPKIILVIELAFIVFLLFN